MTRRERPIRSSNFDGSDSKKTRFVCLRYCRRHYYGYDYYYYRRHRYYCVTQYVWVQMTPLFGRTNVNSRLSSEPGHRWFMPNAPVHGVLCHRVSSCETVWYCLERLCYRAKISRPRHYCSVVVDARLLVHHNGTVRSSVSCRRRFPSPTPSGWFVFGDTIFKISHLVSGTLRFRRNSRRFCSGVFFWHQRRSNRFRSKISTKKKRISFGTFENDKKLIVSIGSGYAGITAETCFLFHEIVKENPY